MIPFLLARRAITRFPSRIPSLFLSFPGPALLYTDEAAAAFERDRKPGI
jgi:hypothetical protein